MWPNRESNPGPLTYESGAIPTALCGPAALMEGETKVCGQTKVCVLGSIRDRTQDLSLTTRMPY